MRGVRTAGRRINHQLGVAVVGSHQHSAAALAQSRVDSFQTTIHRLARPDRRLKPARVPDHIGIGKVNDEHVKAPFFNGFHDGIGNACGAHLGLEVVGCDFLRRHQNALLARIRLLHSAVKKVSDVGVLFSFCHSQVA